MNKFKFRPLSKQAKWVAMLIMMFFASSSFAQGDGTGESTLLTIVIIVAIVAVIVLLVAVYALQVLTRLLRAEEEKRAQNTGEEPVPVLSMWQRFLKIANKRVDIEEEESIILEHNYDGIRELNNHLPPWWSYLFYATIVFSIFYVIFYHVTDTLPLQEEEYEIEMAEAAAMAEMRLAASQAAGTAFSVDNLELTNDTEVLAGGAKIFGQQCVACHKADAGGLIGPNLTDDYWLHGGDIKSVYRTISEGIPGTTMIAWKAAMSAEDMAALANYIKSLRGTNPPDAKDPQGELYEEGTSKSSTVTETATVEDSAVGEIAETDEAKSTFATVCAACHLADGGGLIGPNLTDKYWKNNDGSLEGIKNTISEGVEGTAMVSWKASYDDAQIDGLAKYILSLQGTTPANPKAPEGELVD